MQASQKLHKFLKGTNLYLLVQFDRFKKKLGWEILGNCCCVLCGPLPGNVTIGCVVLLCKNSSSFLKICEPLLRFTETEPGVFTFRVRWT